MNYNDIKVFCDKYFDCDISTKSREKKYVEFRMYYAKLCKKYLYDFSYPGCGRKIKRHHATVIHNIKSFDDYKEVLPNCEFFQIFDKLDEQFLQTFQPDVSEKSANEKDSEILKLRNKLYYIQRVSNKYKRKADSLSSSNYLLRNKLKKLSDNQINV